MKSHGQNNRGRRRSDGRVISRPTAFVATVIIILALVQLLYPRVLSSAFLYAFSPLWSGKNSAMTDLVPQVQLVEENQTLEQELALEESQASSSQALIDQNNELKALLGRPQNTKNLILANILRRPPGAGYDYLILDVGGANGISVGNYVYDAGSTAIGQIASVDSRTSKAELYSTPGTGYDVLIGANHVPATANGQGGGAFSASVSEESGVVVGDPVIVPSISSYPFGYVSAIISDPEQPFEKVLFDNGTNPFQSLFLLVETNSSATKSFAGLVATTTASTTSKASSVRASSATAASTTSSSLTNSSSSSSKKH